MTTRIVVSLSPGRRRRRQTRCHRPTPDPPAGGTRPPCDPLQPHTLLTRNRFPDWDLRDADEFESDLRIIPGEQTNSRTYWEAARSHLEDRLAHLLT
jgi:hypothetical protein